MSSKVQDVSSINQIVENVKFDNNDFSFVDTYGSMIINKPYKSGYEQYFRKQNTEKAFIYKALSAIGNEIEDTLYLNIRKYIDFVSNVDICKVKSLKSMLYLFGFKYTLFDNLNDIPIEIMNLIDVLSINRKYLIKNGILRKEFLQVLSSDENHVLFNVDDPLLKVDFREFFLKNAYNLSVESETKNTSNVNVIKLTNLFKQIDSISVNNDVISNCISNDLSVYIKDDINELISGDLSTSLSCDLTAYISSNLSNYLSLQYENDYSYMIMDDMFNKKFSVYNETKSTILQFDETTIQNNLKRQNDFIECYLSDLNSYGYNLDKEFVASNIDKQIKLIFKNLEYNENTECIDEQQYEEYITGLFQNLIYGYLTMTYNAQFIQNSRIERIYIYPYLGDLYYDNAITSNFSTYEGLEDNEILEIKMFNHIPKSFNEKKIVDDIQNGNDLLTNYTGAQLCVLNLEIQNRDKSLDLTKVGITNNSSKLLQTRYSYYREKDVSQYAKFVDNYYNAITKNPKIYDFDNNYYIIEKDSSGPNVLSVLDSENINPENDINYGMIKTVSQYLAQLTLYICKIREKIKLQTQKNYMKGTNLLLIYIINEYLNEYAKHNKEFFLDGNNQYMLSIYNNLTGHQFGDEDGNYNIQVNEYYDETEYYNISTDTTMSAFIDTDSVNGRFWEETNNLTKPQMMKYDGKELVLQEIEKFYLSTFNLKNTIDAIKDDEYSGLQNFLSTVYDIGANNSFYYKMDEINSISDIFPNVYASLESLLSNLDEMNISNDFLKNFNEQSQLSIFSSILSTNITSSEIQKIYASDIYGRFIKLSTSFDIINSYIDDTVYVYPADTLNKQIIDVRNNHISVNLSNHYMAGVSAIYEKHIDDVNEISSDIDKLSSSYIEFINGTYSYYYKKSKAKYCYEDQDLTLGYLPGHYYLENEVWDNDSMNLYQHLTSLQKYSTEDRIKNFGFIYTVNYISSNFDNIWNGCSDYEGILTINQKLTEKYNFIEPYFDTLDEEIDYSYQFLNNLVEDRKTVLYNQLQSLQDQAANLKTQYDNLNNTFAQAVANFNDKYDGYKLGDSVIHCVSWQEVKDTAAASKYSNKWCKAETKKSSQGYKFYIYAHEVVQGNQAGIYYYDTIDNDGKYGYENIKIEPVYDPKKPLEDQCNAVSAYINTPTSKDWNSTFTKYTAYYGLRGEGIAATIDSVINGINDIKTSFENICSLAESLFGLDTTFSSVDLYQKINDLITLLTSVDETNIQGDAIISEYQKYLQQVIKLSTEYQPVVTAFKNLFQDPEQTGYLEDFTYQMTELTRSNLEILTDFYKEKDSNNFKIIEETIKNLIENDFNDLVIRIQKKITNVNQDILDNEKLSDKIVQLSYSTIYDVEYNTSKIKDKLIEITEYQIKLAQESIDFHMAIVDDCFNIIIGEITNEHINDNERFNEYVSMLIDNLNFFIKDIYVTYQKMYLTYGGNDFCYDPYYNLKNVTHPSYQIHPFLWNMVKKIQGWCLIERGFKAGENLQDITTMRLIGDYGQTIDTWKNANYNIVDFSGYLSRYEQNPNMSTRNAVNEVVDYDGGFYPPAAEDFMLNSKACISSVLMQKKKASVIEKEVSQCLSNDISSYVWYNPSKGIIDNNVYETISSAIEDFFVSNDISLNIYNYLNNSDLSALSSLTKSDIINIIYDSVPQTFYERYYDHLDLPQSQFKYIAYQLAEYEYQIKDIVKPQNEKSVYDIYKYGLDCYKNSYILYKQYEYDAETDVSSITYQDKRNTLGQLWVRLADNPIAFPAFNGEHPAYYIEDANALNTCIKQLASINENGITYIDKYKKHIKSINDKMQYFYDFEITQNKQNIAFMIYNWKLSVKDKFFTRFDLAIVMPQVIEKYYDKKNDLEYLVVKNNTADDNSAIDYIDFDPKNGYISSYRNKYYINEETLNVGVRYPTLVGYYVYDYSIIDFVFIYKKFKKVEEDGDVSYIVQTSNVNEKDKEIGSEVLKNKEYDEVKNFFVIRISNGTTFKAIPSSNGIQINDFVSKHKKTVNDDVCVAYDKNRNYITLAFISQLDIQLSNVITTETSLSDMDFDLNTDGGIISDPLQSEMNSHDIFNQNVSLIDFCKKSSSIEYVNYSEYNINADISYIPQYPYLSGESRLYKKYKKDLYNIELLGKSHDIDKYIKIVNPNPDPYFDYYDILENNAFGRVYEDFIQTNDNSLYQFSNPSLNNNMPSYTDISPFYSYDDTVNGYYGLNYALKNFNKDNPFNDHDIDSMRVLIYNKNTKGKNPYYVGKLIDLVTPCDLNYDQNAIINDLQNRISVDTLEGVKTFVIGTPNTRQLFSLNDSNYINGILKIRAFFDKPTTELQLKFFYDNSISHENVFVKNDTIEIVFFNDKDITLFKYYHFLDSYGAINCQYIDNAVCVNHDLSMDGWGIFYNDGLGKTDISTLLQSYYYGKGGRKEYLKNIELSNYSYLSDVYVLQGNKRLGFKYDEELRFDISSDLYYYPTLNISYPMTIGEYIGIHQPFSINSATIISLSNIFNDDSMFIIGIDDPVEILNNIGQIDIPIVYNDVNDIRAYEDYLSTDDSGFNNYDKYDSTDPRSCQFVHFARIQPDDVQLDDHEIIEDEITVPESFYKNQSLDSFMNSCSSFLSCTPLKSEELTSDITSEYVSINVTSSNCDIQNYLKLYVGYKRNRSESDTLDLYFNYANYLNSPYIKIENGTQIKLDTIEGTYLKLKSGQDGFLDIILQFKYCIGNVIYGYRNVKVLSYHIFNISDDKPKFLIYKAYQLSKNSLQLNGNKTQVNINIIADDLNLDLLQPSLLDSAIDMPVYIDIASSKYLSDDNVIYFHYPYQMMYIDTSDRSVQNGYEIDEEGSALGFLKIKILNTRLGSYKLNFKTNGIASSITPYTNKKFLLDIEGDIYDIDGNICDMIINKSYIEVIKMSNDVLADYNSDKSVIDIIIADNIHKAIIVR